MAGLFEETPVTQNELKECFERHKADGKKFMVVVNQCMEGENKIHTSQTIAGLSGDKITDDLRAIYNNVGQNRISRVIEIGESFDTSRKGGLELLPIRDVIIVEREQAVAEYKDSLVDKRTFWQRLMDGNPGY